MHRLLPKNLLDDKNTELKYEIQDNANITRVINV